LQLSNDLVVWSKWLRVRGMGGGGGAISLPLGLHQNKCDASHFHMNL
jgi:hypothetical protein